MSATITIAVFVLLVIAEVNSAPMTRSETQLMLDLHNKARREVANAADMTELVWDTALERDAQRYADTCPSGHASGTNQGENLAWGWPSRTVAGAMNGWVEEERPFFDYNRRNWCNGGVCGHYTQIIWAKTTRVGCARRSRCRNMMGLSQAGDVYVCRYTKQGNMIGQRPYRQGRPCSACSGRNNQCNNGLCSSTGGSSVTDRTRPVTTTRYQVDKLFSCANGQRLVADSEGNGKFEHKCSFPFSYKGVEYTGCSNEDFNSPWCVLEDKSQGVWGLCSCVDVVTTKKPYSTPRVPDTPPPIPVTGKFSCKVGQRIAADSQGNGVFDQTCVLPFRYSGVLYTTCEAVDSGDPWCPLEVQPDTLDVTGPWGVCTCVDITLPTSPTLPTRPSAPTKPDISTAIPSFGTNLWGTGITKINEVVTNPATCIPCDCSSEVNGIIAGTNGSQHRRQTVSFVLFCCMLFVLLQKEN